MYCAGCINCFHTPFAVQTIKETLDKKLGGPWHVVAGTSFSYDVTHKVCPKQSLASQMMACLFVIAIHIASIYVIIPEE